MLRELASRESGDLLVFWTIVDTERVLSHEVRPSLWDAARQMEDYWGSISRGTKMSPGSIKKEPSMLGRSQQERPSAQATMATGTLSRAQNRKEQASATTSSMSKEGFELIIASTRRAHPDARLKVGSGNLGSYVVECEDCEWTRAFQTMQDSAGSLWALVAHLVTSRHRGRVNDRFDMETSEPRVSL